MLVVALAAVLLSFAIDAPHSPQNWISDWVVAYFSKQPSSQDDRIALVYISEATLADKPYVSPVDRQRLAELVRAVDQAGADVIGLDIIFDRETEKSKDEGLRDTLRETRARIVLGVVDAQGDAQKFQAKFLGELGLNEKCSDTSYGGHFSCGHVYFDLEDNPLVISDNVVRFIAEGPSKAAFSDALAKSTREQDGRERSSLNWLVNARYIDWLREPRDGTETFFSIDGKSLLDNSLAQYVRPLLRGRIVLIGGNFSDRDQHLTPFSVSSHHRYPGLFIHAQSLAQLLGGRVLMETGNIPTAALALVALVLGYSLGQRSGHFHLFLELGGILGLLLTTWLAFVAFAVVFPFTWVAVAWLIGAAVGHYGNPWMTHLRRTG